MAKQDIDTYVLQTEELISLLYDGELVIGDVRFIAPPRIVSLPQGVWDTPENQRFARLQWLRQWLENVG